MSYLDRTGKILKHGGAIYYVATDGNDSNTGLSPDVPLLTIGAAFIAVVMGDGISVKAGTYTEVGLNLDTDAVTLLLGSGVIISPASGDCLTVSGNYCDVLGHAEMLPIADVNGVLVSGDGCKVSGTVDEGALVVLGTLSLTCICVTGDKSELERINATGVKVGGKVFDLQGSNTAIRACGGYGAGEATYGFYVEGSVGLMEDCFSLANGTSGFYFATGVAFWTIKDSMSGAGDGRWVDSDEAQMWDGFSFDDRLETELDLAQAGAGTYQYNLFKVTGTIKIKSIMGIVEVALTGSNTSVHLDVYSTNGNSVLSKATTLAIGAAIKGSLIAKLDLKDKILAFSEPSGPQAVEGIDIAAEGFRVLEDRTGGAHVDTYIRFIHSTAGVSSGEVHWYVEWEPISEDGFLAQA